MLPRPERDSCVPFASWLPPRLWEPALPVTGECGSAGVCAAISQGGGLPPLWLCPLWVCSSGQPASTELVMVSTQRLHLPLCSHH